MSKEIRIKVSPVLTSPKNDIDDYIDDNDNMAVRRIPAVYSYPSKAGYFRPWRFTQAARSGVSKIFYAKTTKFRILLDVDQFNSESLRVEVVGNYIEVEGQQDTINDKLGSISRWMKRKYKVPSDVKLETMNSALHMKGTIVINADRNLKDSLGPTFNKAIDLKTKKSSSRNSVKGDEEEKFQR